MHSEEIVLVVDPEGNVHLEVKGVQGPSCLEISRPIAEAIGDIEAQQHTPDFYAVARTSVSEVERNRSGS